MKPRKSEIWRTAADVPEDPAVLAAGKLIDGERLDGAHVTGEDHSGRTILELDIRRSVVEAFSFAGSHLRSAHFRDVRFVRCDFSNVTARGLDAKRVEFVDCRLIGIKAIECRMEDVLLDRCDARYGQFTDGVARCCDFIDTQLQEADFRAVNLGHTRWIRADLSRRFDRREADRLRFTRRQHRRTHR